MNFKKISFLYIYICIVSSAYAEDPFDKTTSSIQTLIDGFTNIVTPLMVLMIMVVGIGFIIGKIPKTLAASIAVGGIIVGAAGPIADIFY